MGQYGSLWFYVDLSVSVWIVVGLYGSVWISVGLRGSVWAYVYCVIYFFFLDYFANFPDFFSSKCKFSRQFYSLSFMSVFPSYFCFFLFISLNMCFLCKILFVFLDYFVNFCSYFDNFTHFCPLFG